jgi:hypothetical protein
MVAGPKSHDYGRIHSAAMGNIRSIRSLRVRISLLGGVDGFDQDEGSPGRFRALGHPAFGEARPRGIRFGLGIISFVGDGDMRSNIEVR